MSNSLATIYFFIFDKSLAITYFYQTQHFFLSQTDIWMKKKTVIAEKVKQNKIK